MFNYSATITTDIGHSSLKIEVEKSFREIVAAILYPLIKEQSGDYLISKLLLAMREICTTVSYVGISPISVGIAAKGIY